MRRISTLLLFLAPCLTWAQDCDTPPSSDWCESTSLICDVEILNGYCLDMGPAIPTHSGPNPICQLGGVPSNVRWIAFMAPCDKLTLTFTPEACEQDSGQARLQVALFGYPGTGACTGSLDPPLVEVACAEILQLDASYAFQVEGLVPGHPYYLLFNGAEGTSCRVRFAVEHPCAGELMESWPGPLNGPLNACVGGTFFYQLDLPFGANRILWTVDGSVVDEGVDELAIIWTGPGTYQLCGQALNACASYDDALPLRCVSVVVEEVLIADTVIVLCQYNDPLVPGLTAPCGPMEVTLTTLEGCDSIVRLDILCNPVLEDLGTILLCPGEEVDVYGHTFTCADVGSRVIVLPGTGGGGCDSIVTFSIACREAHIEGEDEMFWPWTSVTLSGTLMPVPDSAQILRYQWFRMEGGIPVFQSEGMEWHATQPGLYRLEVEILSADSMLLCRVWAEKEIKAGSVQIPPRIRCAEAVDLCYPAFLVPHFLEMTAELTGYGPSPICEQLGAPHNPHWITFIAPCEALTIQVVPSNCSQVGGYTGLQYAVYRYGGDGICVDEMLDYEVIMCQANPCFTTPWQLTSDAFVPGERYYLMIDGCAGSVCDVMFQFLPGPNCAGDPPPLSWTAGIEGPSSVCSGETASFQVPDAYPGSQYLWSVDGNPIAFTASPSWTYQWPQAGNHTVCAGLAMSCFSPSLLPDPLCMTIEVEETIHRPGRPYFLCEDASVLLHGVYWSCADSGMHVIPYQQTASPFCDSLVGLEIHCLKPEAFVLPPLPMEPGDTSVLLDGSLSKEGPPPSVTRYQWTASGGGWLAGPADQPVTLAGSPGVYCLEVTAASPNGVVACSDQYCVTVEEGRSSAQASALVPAERLRVWPRPGDRYVTISVDGNKPLEDGVLTVYSATGAIQMETIWGGGQKEMVLSTGSWVPGWYTVRLNLTDRLLSDRLLVLR